MRHESIPLAPEIIFDRHSRFEKPEDCPLYPHIQSLLQELRERYIMLSHSGCGGETRNPKIELGKSYVMLDQIQFPSWLQSGHDCRVPLKVIDGQNRYGYFAWSQIITSSPKDLPIEQVVDRLVTPVSFRGKTVPLIEVGHEAFLGHTDASRFLSEFNQR